MAYAWIITKDHLNGPGGEFAGQGYADEAGTMGPSDAPQELQDRLRRGEGHTFRMYDDDGNLYYTGKALGTGEDEPVGENASENFCYGPLRDYGAPNAGAVVIRWHGHQGWEVG